MRPRVVVMVKEPRPGRVKSRLGRDIGMTTAAWWFRHQVSALLRRLRDPRWDLVLAVSPDAEGLESRVWPEDLPRVPQGAGDLGDRMGRILRSMPPGPTMIIGADIPGISKHEIASALRCLQGADAVLGPAPDGGYWLIGWRGVRPLPGSALKGVRWSTCHAMTDTIATLEDCRIAMAATLRDVDTARDLDQIAE